MQTSFISRRRFLGASAGALAWAALPRACKGAEVLETRTISQQPDLYHGWPTLTRRRNGQLLLVWSGGREGHVCPFGRVEGMVSDDEGRSWSWPRVLLDGPIDDRDAGVLETVRGSILVTTFTSLAYEPILQRAEAAKNWPESRLHAWQAAHRRISPEQRQAELGQWMIRSTDDGVTWSARYSSVVNSPHGPIQLDDGRLLYAGKELWTGQQRVGVCESADDGVSWQWLAEIPTRPGDTKANYHELHAVDTGQGRIVVQIRNHNPTNDREILQTESGDGGRTWSVPEPIGVWGLPSFLLRLRDGRLFMTYGHRRPPFGNQARISSDGGKTWSEPIVVSGDGEGGDLGYPSAVELGDGSVLVAWYELRKGSERASLRQARLRLG